jgi:hypothetical protein
LNVGGHQFDTSLSTLTKHPKNMLGAMFSGRHQVTKDKDGRFFIDVDGTRLIYILNYPRFGEMSLEVKREDGSRDAEFFSF